MRKQLITGLICLVIMSAATVTLVKSNEIYEEENISVQGQVTNKDIKSNQQQAAEAAPIRKNLVELRKRREIGSLQQSPDHTKNTISLKVVARSYCLRGFTSRGVQTRMGVIAVDPSIIPYGSKIYIPGFGWGTALDTGGAIVGRNIDIWMPTYGQCMQWGVREIMVKVVKP